MVRKVTRRGLTLSIVLSLTAGYVDAIGFIDTGGLFVSFMSGNSTQAGVEVLEHGITAAVMPLSLVLAFVLGVAAAALVGGADRRRLWAVAGAAAAVAGSAALAAFLPDESWRFWMLAFAMGALNTLYLGEGRARVAITYATGTLVSLGLALAALVAGEPRAAWQRPLILWGSLAGGAVVGAAAHTLGSAVSLLIAAGVLAVVALVLIPRRDRRGAPDA